MGSKGRLIKKNSGAAPEGVQSELGGYITWGKKALYLFTSRSGQGP